MAASARVLAPVAVPNSGGASGPDVPWQENLNLSVVCPDCKEFPPNLVEEFSSGDMVCGSCGLVLGDRIVDTRSEWRTFSNDDQGNDDPSRVGDGANPLLNGSQLQTTISFGDGGSGRSRELHRAQNKSTHDKSTKGLLAAYKEIGAFCDAINIPKNVSDTAKHLFKLVDDAKAFKGKPQDVLSAGCIFIACRQCGVPRTFREVFAVTKVAKKEIGRIFKALEKFFAAQNKEKMDLTVQNGGKDRGWLLLLSRPLLTIRARNRESQRFLYHYHFYQGAAVVHTILQSSRFIRCLHEGVAGTCRTDVVRRCPRGPLTAFGCRGMHLYDVLPDETGQDRQGDLSRRRRERWYYSNGIQVSLRRT